jgi:hypothetical protein
MVLSRKAIHIAVKNKLKRQKKLLGKTTFYINIYDLISTNVKKKEKLSQGFKRLTEGTYK